GRITRALSGIGNGSVSSSRSNDRVPPSAFALVIAQPFAAVTVPAASSVASLTNPSAPSPFSSAAAIINWPGAPGWTASPVRFTPFLSCLFFAHTSTSVNLTGVNLTGRRIHAPADDAPARTELSAQPGGGACGGRSADRGGVVGQPL